MLETLTQGICDLFFPANCVLCRNALIPEDQRRMLCSVCRSRIFLNKPPFCSRCCRPCPEIFAGTSSVECTECRRDKPAFDSGIVACTYNDPIRHLLHHFKYNQRTYLRFLFTDLLMEFIETHPSSLRNFDLVTSIPLHPVRLRERGFNQAALLGKRLADRLALPWKPDCLMRTRQTASQTTLRQKDRWTNIRGAFRIGNSSGLKGSRVLLVDDLLTTGATFSEAAGILKSAGAQQAGIAAVAFAE